MKIISRRILYFGFACMPILFFSCKKDSNPASMQHISIDSIGVAAGQTPFFINESILVIDNTIIAQPIGNKIFEWSVSPDNGCYAIYNGFTDQPVFVFKCSGSYRISAVIYDSVTHGQVGRTDTISLNITNDTLFNSIPIFANDSLNIRALLPINNPLDSPNSITLYFTTSKLYNDDYTLL